MVQLVGCLHEEVLKHEFESQNVVVVYFNPKCEKKETGESLGAHQIASLA